MSKALFLKGMSQYNVLRYFTDELMKGFEQQGWETEVLDFYLGDEEANRRRLEELQQCPPDVAIAFNGICQADVRRYLDIPYVGFMVDPPAMHHIRYVDWADKDYAICIDRHHATIMNQYYTNMGGAFFVPHGGSVAKQQVTYGDRTIDVAFSGSYHTSQSYLDEMQSVLEPYECQVAFAVLTIMEERNLEMEQALECFLTENQIPFSSEEFTNLCLRYYNIDSYVRAFYREELLRALTDNGIVVDIYGNGWDAFDCANKENLRIHPPVDYEESLEIMANTKISLNSIPSYKAGAHERIFSAMVNGSLCVTDPSEYLSEQFADGEEIVYYQRDNIQKAAREVLYYLENEDEAEKITQKARQVALRSHTWEARAKDVIAILQECIGVK